MYSSYKYKKDDLMSLLQTEFESSGVLDEVFNQILSKLQPWVLTIIVIFGVYFILIIGILILILRNDIKK